MRALKQIREVPARLDASVETLLAQFSTTALELSPSVGLKEFARRLTSRVARIFGARTAVVALRSSCGWQIAGTHGGAGACEPTTQKRLAEALGEAGSSLRAAPLCGSADEIVGEELAQTLGWRKAILVRLARTDTAASGILCLADLRRSLAPAEQQVLVALGAHAAVALENVQLFSRIEQSRKQWVQDVDAISDFIFVHDSAGRILRLNRALADHLGTRPTEAIGWDVGTLGILGSSAQEAQCPFCRNALAAGEEFVYPAGDRTYVVSSSRIRSNGNGNMRTVHVLKDITDRREAERRYRRERDFNRNILNNTQSMILVLDSAGLVSYANRRCFELGYREDDLLGHSLVEMIPLGRRSILSDAVERALAGVAIDSIELPILRGSDSCGTFSISLSPMRDENGEINSVVVVMADVTDAATLQSKLMHTEKMAALGQLVSGVAHEVNNPLAAIVGFTDLLLENPAICEDAKQDLAVILQEAQRTRQIVQNLLSFARQVPAQREPVRINTVVQQTVKLRSYDIRSHGVEVIESYGDELPLAIGDPHELQQVFLNILNNAYDAIQEVPRRGRIEISTLRDDGHVEIRFSDNGPGIQHKERIFDPFYTTKEVGKGTGLGLSICYGIIHSHGGEIIAQNNPDGHGCTFSVRLPAASEALAASVAEEAAR